MADQQDVEGIARDLAALLDAATVLVETAAGFRARIIAAGFETRHANLIAAHFLDHLVDKAMHTP